jgi:hypothetical protein
MITPTPSTMTTMTTVTLSAIKAHGPCEDGWANLLAHLERIGHHAEEIPLRVILEGNSIQDAIWALRAAEQTEEHQRKCRLFAVWCARQVQHLTDQRSIEALNVAERHANGEATDKELHAACLAARDAAYEYVGTDSVLGVYAARRATQHAAMGNAEEAAWYASMEAVRAAGWQAVRAAAWDWGNARKGAEDDYRQAQAAKFIEMFCS